MNEAYAGSFLIGMLVGMVLAGIATVLLGGLIIKGLTKVIAKFSPPYLRCFLAMLVSVVATGVVYFAISAVAVAISSGGGDLPSPDSYGAIARVMIIASGMSLVLGFVINTAVLNWLLLRPDGSRLGFGLASVVTLAQIVVCGVLALFFFVAMVAMSVPVGMM